MILKRDYIECSECGESFHQDATWEHNMDANAVCFNCSDEMPYVVIGSIDYKKYYGAAEYGEEEITTGYYEDEDKARDRINAMSKVLWGLSPIEGK